MSRDLLAQSLRDFSSDAWWAICDSFVDGDASASPSELAARVRQRVRKGDLLRASASYGDDRGEDEGARLLTEKILRALADQHVIEPDGDNWRVTRAYLELHDLAGGGIRFAYNIDGSWTTYDALPREAREARRQADTDRLNMSAAIANAANYRRPVQTGEERPPRYATARQAAYDLYTSLREYGYLDAFPVTLDRDGRVVSGNHRMRFAELARADLAAELADVQTNGSDPIVVADLERRIASLDRDRILSRAVVVTNDADEIRVTTASEVQIPWTAHERQQLAKRLLIEDGLSVAEVAERLRVSEQTVREWTLEERVDVKLIQQAEARRLLDAGWSQRRVAKHLGVTEGAVRHWVRNSAGTREITQITEEHHSTPDSVEDSTVEMTPSAVKQRVAERNRQAQEVDPDTGLHYRAGGMRPSRTQASTRDEELLLEYVAQLEQENTVLRARVSQLERENAELRR